MSVQIAGETAAAPELQKSRGKDSLGERQSPHSVTIVPVGWVEEE